jgi:peptidyl-prolyl cis-trans isomerase C
MKLCLIAAACAVTLTAQIAPAPLAPPDTVVAKVDGADITIQDMQTLLLDAPPDFTQQLGKQPEIFLREMYRLKFLAGEGDKLMLGDKSPTKERVEAERMVAVAQARINFEQDSYSPSEQELNDFYAANQVAWSTAKIKVILIGFQPDPTPGAVSTAKALNDRSSADAAKFATDLVLQLRTGADFAALAEKYSDDKESKANGGDFGVPVKPTGNLPDDLKRAIFAMQPGQVSDPLRQPTGFYIIRLEEMNAQPLSDVIEQITQQLKGAHSSAWLKDLNTRLAPKLSRPEFFTQPVNPNAKPGATVTIAGSTFKPDTVIATVEGADVTVQHFQDLVARAPADFIRQLGPKPDAFLQQMYILDYLAADADKMKLGEKSPLKEQFEWQRRLEIATARVNLEQDSYQPTEKEINDYYTANQSSWSAATIKVILLGFKPDLEKGTTEDAVKRIAEQALNGAHALNDRSQTEATKLAADLVAQLRAGADFGKLAAQYSDDKESKNDGGDFGMAVKTTTKVPEDFKAAIFALKPGEISDPVRQPTGFYIIKLEKKEVQPLREVSAPIAQKIKENHRTEWLDGLSARFTPKLVRPEFFTQQPK